ncbi:hemolysin family protein [Actinoallomurus acaciae]|uniref:Hemolysin family protein n=1 Tax=Actinoallomurus acaciae TaxID=502577 RepID=A0ABV5YBH3_9ACTN
MLSALAGVAAVLALTVATGYFVAQEFAFVAADRARLDAAAQRGDVRARRALAAMGRLSFTLSGAQLGITVTALVVGFIAEPATSALVRPLLDGIGVPGAEPVAVAAGFVLATVVQMVLGELLPKNLALARAESLAKFLTPSTLAYLRVAGPLIRLFDAAATRLLRAVGVEPVEELHHGATLTELGDIIGESHRSGSLPADLSALLERALTFGERTAAEVMVPRPDVVLVSAATTVARVTDLIATAGHTNYPVYGRGTDDVVGIAGVREITKLASPDEPIADLVRPALLVPDTLPLHSVIARMREAGEEFACVVDEYGGLAGILTFEDIAEELVGDIADENDAVPAVPAAAEGAWTLNAATRIAQVRDLTGLALPTDPAYDSISGLVMARIGRLPQAGDRIEVDLDPESGSPGRAEVEVLGVRRRVARTILLRRIPQRAEDRGRDRS